jgi:hypothetical protein
MVAPWRFRLKNILWYFPHYHHLYFYCCPGGAGLIANKKRTHARRGTKEILGAQLKIHFNPCRTTLMHWQVF